MELAITILLVVGALTLLTLFCVGLFQIAKHNPFLGLLILLLTGGSE